MQSLVSDPAEWNIYLLMCLLELVRYSTCKLAMLWLHMKLIYLGICGGLGVRKLQVNCTETLIISQGACSNAMADMFSSVPFPKIFKDF